MPTPREEQVLFRHRYGSKGFNRPQQLWIEAPINADWKVAYRVFQQDGLPVIGELRIFPREGGPDDPLSHPGEWTGTNASAATVPARGITTRLLRQVQPATDFAIGLKAGNRYVKLIPAAVPRLREAGFRSLRRAGASRAGGRRGWSEDNLLAAALFYVERGGRRPVADLAAKWKITPAQARDMLTAARRKGLLTSGRQGQTSRALTDMAKELLAKRSQS